MPRGEHPFDEEIILNKNKNKNEEEKETGPLRMISKGGGSNPS